MQGGLTPIDDISPPPALITNCSGTELKLGECLIDRVDMCSRRAAGVVCQGSYTKFTIDLSIYSLLIEPKLLLHQEAM